MSNAQNKDVLESTTSYATIWSDTDWKKTYKYVNKQRHRIFRAESEGDRRKVISIKEVYQQRINSDKGLFEPYVLKGTRTVLERVRMSNHPILSNLCLFLITIKNKFNFNE